MRQFAAGGLSLVMLFGALGAAPQQPVLQLGGRLEPLVDDHVIERFVGAAALQVHRPLPREVVLVTDRPWEGNTCAYYTVFRDGEILRMYYRGSHFDEKTRRAAHPEVTCYAESRDGIHWTRPDLGLFEFAGSKKNNIVWDGIGAHCFAVFKDTQPNCRPDARYKAISRGRPKGKKGLYVFKSPDGIHWSLLQDEPVITTGAFDSQNLAFWDRHAGEYREYHRSFDRGVRSIMTSTSKDFVHWTEPRLLDYVTPKREQLYTNAILPYPGAPHILVGFPTRYLPKQGSRVEPILMTSRDRVTFRRFDAVLVPEDAPKDRGGNRSNYMAWGLVQLPGQEREYSVYATEAYYAGPDSRLRRFAFRRDGLVSIRSAAAGGGFVSQPLVFDGRALVLNFATNDKGQGAIRVGLLDAAGKPIDGFQVADCVALEGDHLARTVEWKSGKDLRSLTGKTVRLTVQMQAADLYSLRFTK